MSQKMDRRARERMLRRADELEALADRLEPCDENIRRHIDLMARAEMLRDAVAKAGRLS